jgi:hypothetical protein
MTCLLPPNDRDTNVILPTDRICMDSQQQVDSQTEGSPALVATKGSKIALRYQENGHVTLPQNTPGKPPGSGTVSVYGTVSSDPEDSLLEIHNVWTTDGRGGDGRGRLLSRQSFDDGECYQINSGPISLDRQRRFPHIPDAIQGADLWCRNLLELPSDIEAGSFYTLYWDWDWPTAFGTPGAENGKLEIYTTCMDIQIV